MAAWQPVFLDSELAHFGEHVNKMSEFNPAPVVQLEAVLAFVLVYLISSRSSQPTGSFGARTGAALGLATSATWSLANAATFKMWSLALTLGDVAWHTALGALMGWLVVWLWNRLAPKG
ncbi:MAG: DUF2177 family protein [Saprospiraceae bacterium]|nr:DUF2177 family protein [Saprospiraceae bacterium]